MSNPKEKAVATASINLYNRFFEYERVISNVEITDEGIYQVGQIPDTYGGANLTLQCVHAVFMVNSKAEMIMLEFEVQSPMDKGRKSGGPINRDGTVIRPKTGDSTEELKQYTIANPNLDTTRKSLGAAAKALFYADLARHADQQKS